MQRKRILFLASWYPSRENEALGNFVQRHAEVANKVADVTVMYAVSSFKNNSIEFERKSINGVDTLIIFYPKVKSKLPLIKQYLSKRKYLNVLKKGLDYLKVDFDLVHLNEAFPAGLFALYLKNKKSLKYVLTVHWTGYLDHTKSFESLSFYERYLHKKIFKKASMVFPVSDHLGNSLKKLNLISEYEVIPNVVNNEIFYPKNQKDPSAITRFLHVSSFKNKQKNVVEMLKAFKNVQEKQHDFILHLITEDDKSEVWKLIDQIGIEPSKCEVEEKAKPSRVAEAMRLADCFVLFSNYETFSVVIAEAWMSGVPAIYSRCGGLTEISNPELGVRIEKGDTSALTRAILEFNKEDYKRDKIVAQSSAFKVDVIAKKFLDVYSAL